MRGQNGITLIALIITVIVLLILAGVAISALTTDGGLFGRVKNAANQYNQSVEEEYKGTQNALNLFNEYAPPVEPEL